MSVHKRRIELMKVLVAGSVVGGRSEIIDITGELEEVTKVQRVPQLPRRRLLQVLHSTRAMDTTLATFLAFHNIMSGRSLGGYINKLGQSNPPLRQLSPGEVQQYQNDIVNLRNEYMHRAGGFPGGDSEITALLSNMHACLTRILNL